MKEEIKIRLSDIRLAVDEFEKELDEPLPKELDDIGLKEKKLDMNTIMLALKIATFSSEIHRNMMRIKDVGESSINKMRSDLEKKSEDKSE